MQTSDRERFNVLVRARHSCIYIPTHEEGDALDLVRDAAMGGGRRLIQWDAAHGVSDGIVAGTACVPNTENAAAALVHIERESVDSMVVMLDLVPHLGDPAVLRAWRNAAGAIHSRGGVMVLIDHSTDAPPVVSSWVTRFELQLPGEQQLEEILRSTLRRIHRDNPIEVDLTRRELQTILRNLRGLTRRQAEQVIVDAVAEDRRFHIEDLNTILARKRQLLQADGLLEYVESPVSLDQIGGLRRLKRWLDQRRHAMTEEAQEYGIGSPRGVLMLGVQGAGKSMCAKAIATAWQRPLLRMDVGALYDKYIGESERRLRDALHQTEVMAPIILWIDEIEKAFAGAASQSNDGGLSRRMFGTLLTWMQEHREAVFLVATANDIEALPPELMRKGRFDEIFFVDLPCPETREQIFRIHLEKRRQDPSRFDIGTLGRESEGFSGAEIEQAVVAALHEAFSARAELTSAMITEVLRNSPPLSVTMRERIASLRRWADGRCVPAD